MSTKKTKINFAPICARLLRVRLESGLTDVEISRISGRSHGWWHSLKNSMHDPYPSTIDMVADNLGLDAMWIKSGEGSEPDWKQFKVDMQLRSELEKKTYRNLANDIRRIGGKLPKGTAAIMSTDGTMPLQLDAEMLGSLDKIASYIGISRGQLLDKIDQLKSEQTVAKQ